MSCGAKYSVPDGRLENAGADGLRVRCTRCRAIMVVSESQRFLFEKTPDPSREMFAARADDDEDTRPSLPRRRRNTGAPSAAVSASMHGLAVGDDPQMPAALSASGVYRPLEGVQRNVTGFYFPEIEELKRHGKQTSSRIWYAAIDGSDGRGARPRGPFSASEMVELAHKGKVRDATLVWRPGFGGWKRVKHGEAGTSEDLSWLKNVVTQRKVREREAEREAEKRGIKPVQLSRTSQGPRPARAHGPLGGHAPGMPPPLPDEVLDERALKDEPAGAILPLSEMLEGAPEREWRAASLPNARSISGTRARPSEGGAAYVWLSAAVFLGCVGGLVVSAVGAPWARMIATVLFR
jgi:hypothetical protein